MVSLEVTFSDRSKKIVSVDQWEILEQTAYFYVGTAISENRRDLAKQCVLVAKWDDVLSVHQSGTPEPPSG